MVYQETRKSVVAKIVRKYYLYKIMLQLKRILRHLPQQSSTLDDDASNRFNQLPAWRQAEFTEAGVSGELRERYFDNRPINS